MSDFDYFPPSRPRRTTGGIKAQTRRGRFGESWWAERWVSVLESFDIGARLGRGRSYARAGQILDLDIAQGRVTASVQGSRPRPYAVTIEMQTLSKAQWSGLARALRTQAVFAAKLLAGEMPRDIETAFVAAGLTLFPAKSSDLLTECSCPDWSNPCKHVAAVYYLLAEEFDRDPFLLFRLRGMERSAFIGLLRGAESPQRERIGRRRQGERAVPLASKLATFWEGGVARPPDTGEAAVPQQPALLAKRLGNFPFWRGELNLLDALEDIYGRAAAIGAAVYIGERPVGGGDSRRQT
jgi:uncharacterized Zn finger protein